VARIEVAASASAEEWTGAGFRFDDERRGSCRPGARLRISLFLGEVINQFSAETGAEIVNPEFTDEKDGIERFAGCNAYSATAAVNIRDKGAPVGDCLLRLGTAATTTGGRGGCPRSAFGRGPLAAARRRSGSASCLA
jgi:hypothetical protein